MPNDAFGQHYASAFRFNDQVNQTELYQEALKYYANILTPFSKLVVKKIEEVLSLKLPVDIIAPSHGVIWRKNPLQIVEKYREWAAQAPEKSALILYDIEKAEQQCLKDKDARARRRDREASRRS